MHCTAQMFVANPPGYQENIWFCTHSLLNLTEMNMDNESGSGVGTELKNKVGAKANLLVRVIFSGLVVALIALMAAISIYGDKLNEGASPPADAADH